MEPEKISDAKQKLSKDKLAKSPILIGGHMMVHLVNRHQPMIVKFG
jgi:hypothetical protein